MISAASKTDPESPSLPNSQLAKIRRSYLHLSRAVNALEKLQPEQSTIDKAIKRGYFLPEEDDYLWSLISRYLTIRSGFWEIIDEMSAYFSDDIQNVKTLNDWRHFLLGYAASCQAVYMARMLVDKLASHKLVQRKMNEGAPQHRIPRKLFTYIFQSLSDADNAIKMQYMMSFVDSNQSFVETLEHDEYVSCVVKNLNKLEKALHQSQLAYIKLRFKYLWHAITRRGAASKQLTSFFILEKAGRAIAEIGVKKKPRVTLEIRNKIEKLLKPGDVIIIRHDLVASNLFLPGYWPHAALYIGTEEEREALNMAIENDIAMRWRDQICILEAKSDGVLFRALTEALEVDEFVIIRPTLTQKQLAKGLERAVQHEGKGYNFDFDFFRSDQLVCTEVVFRAFDGLGDIQFKLTERAGRLSLSAEDLLNMAIDEKGFSVMAIFGIKSCRKTIIEGDEARKLVIESMNIQAVH